MIRKIYLVAILFLYQPLFPQGAQTFYLNGKLVNIGVNLCGAVGGTANALTCSVQNWVGTFAYTDGAMYAFKPTAANTTGVTVAIGGAAAKTVRKQGGAANLATGDLCAAQWAIVSYDVINDVLEMQSPSCSANVFVSVKDYGAVGDCSTDDTAAFTSAVAGISSGGTLFVPAVVQCYLVTNLVWNRKVNIQGGGFKSTRTSSFGSSNWFLTASTSGAVIRCTSTTSTCLLLDNSDWTNNPLYGITLSDFMLLGPGSGTTKGLGTNVTNQGLTQMVVRNVQVTNFSTGWDIAGVQSGKFFATGAIGDDTGYVLRQNDGVNQCSCGNWFYGTTLEANGAFGFRNIGNPSINLIGGICQGVSATGVGIQLEGGADSNSIIDWYFESNELTDGTAAAVRLTSASRTRIEGGHFGDHSAGGSPMTSEIDLVGASDNIIVIPSISPNKIRIDAASARNTLHLDSSGANEYTDAGASNLIDYNSSGFNFPSTTTSTFGGGANFGGPLRMSNNSYLKGRNAANSADINIIKVNGSNELQLDGVNVNFTNNTIFSGEIRASNSTNIRCANDGNCNIGASTTVGRPATVWAKTLVQSQNFQSTGLAFASLPTCNAGALGTLIYCTDCKNVIDDTTGTFDSAAASGGHGTNVLCEGSVALVWRVH